MILGCFGNDQSEFLPADFPQKKLEMWLCNSQRNPVWTAIVADY